MVTELNSQFLGNCKLQLAKSLLTLLFCKCRMYLQVNRCRHYMYSARYGRVSLDASFYVCLKILGFKPPPLSASMQAYGIKMKYTL